MRHSSINLTMNVYTDPKLLDVAGALDMLPDLPLNDFSNTEYQQATGANAVDALAPMLAPNLVQTGQIKSKPVETNERGQDVNNSKCSSVTSYSDNNKKVSSCPDDSFPKSGRRDLNPRPLRPERSALAKLSYSPQFV